MSQPLQAVPMFAVEQVPDTAPSPPIDPNQEVAEIQAASEGVPSGDSVLFQGERFRIADRVGLMPLMKFAHVSKQDINSDDMEGLDVMYVMLQDCIVAEDWARFEATAIRTKASHTELFDVVGETMALIAARPTQQPSASSSTPAPTSANSTDGSSRQGLAVPATIPQADLVPVADLGASLSA